ncbi:hypothetical protein FQZ97_843540 [compost metagenome]
MADECAGGVAGKCLVQPDRGVGHIRGVGDIHHEKATAAATQSADQNRSPVGGGRRARVGDPTGIDITGEWVAVHEVPVGVLGQGVVAQASVCGARHIGKAFCTCGTVKGVQHAAVGTDVDRVWPVDVRRAEAGVTGVLELQPLWSSHRPEIGVDDRTHAGRTLAKAAGRSLA